MRERRDAEDRGECKSVGGDYKQLRFPRCEAKTGDEGREEEAERVWDSGSELADYCDYAVTRTNKAGRRIRGTGTHMR